MCKLTTCPNDGKPTWWGCGNHVEIALAGIPEGERCDCLHVPSKESPGMYEVPKRDEGPPIKVHLNLEKADKAETSEAPEA